MVKKIDCRNCEEEISAKAKYCPHCGTRQKKKKKEGQRSLKGQGKQVDKLQDRIEYLEGELEDAGIKFDNADDDDDDDDEE